MNLLKPMNVNETTKYIFSHISTIIDGTTIIDILQHIPDHWRKYNYRYSPNIPDYWRNYCYKYFPTYHQLLTELQKIFSYASQLLMELQYYSYSPTNPLATRSLGAVVAVRMCCPSGHHSKLVVSGDWVCAVNFLVLISQNSKFPRRFPKPAKHKSNQY